MKLLVYYLNSLRTWILFTKKNLHETLTRLVIIAIPIRILKISNRTLNWEQDFKLKVINVYPEKRSLPLTFWYFC